VQKLPHLTVRFLERGDKDYSVKISGVPAGGVHAKVVAFDGKIFGTRRQGLHR